MYRFGAYTGRSGPLNFFLWLESVTSSTPIKRLGRPSCPEQLPS